MPFTGNLKPSFSGISGGSHRTETLVVPNVSLSHWQHQALSSSGAQRLSDHLAICFFRLRCPSGWTRGWLGPPSALPALAGASPPACSLGPTSLFAAAVILPRADSDLSFTTALLPLRSQVFHWPAVATPRRGTQDKNKLPCVSALKTFLNQMPFSDYFSHYRERGNDKECLFHLLKPNYMINLI